MSVIDIILKLTIRYKRILVYLILGILFSLVWLYAAYLMYYISDSNVYYDVLKKSAYIMIGLTPLCFVVFLSEEYLSYFSRSIFFFAVKDSMLKKLICTISGIRYFFFLLFCVVLFLIFPSHQTLKMLLFFFALFPVWNYVNIVTSIKIDIDKNFYRDKKSSVQKNMAERVPFVIMPVYILFYGLEKIIEKTQYHWFVIIAAILNIVFFCLIVFGFENIFYIIVERLGTNDD